MRLRRNKVFDIAQGVADIEQLRECECAELCRIYVRAESQALVTDSSTSTNPKKRFHPFRAAPTEEDVPEHSWEHSWESRTLSRFHTLR